VQLLGLLCAVFGALIAATSAAAQTRYDVEVVAAYPHDPGAFTQGLFIKGGALYESTGLEGRSSLRKVRLETGEVLQKVDLPPEVFGEGIAPYQDKIIALTWRSQIGFVFDARTFRRLKRFTYAGEGWGLTSDGKRLIMSDGTDELRFLDPKSLKETGRLKVTHKGEPLRHLNELEWIDGEVFANVWMTNSIVRIDPKSGAVTAVINAKSLSEALGGSVGPDAVLNGIAWDAEQRRLFLTGKTWPKLFEVRLKERTR
jgi:glutamine cyclotransferase